MRDDATLDLPVEAPDGEVVDRIRGGDTGLYEVLMKRYNHRVARVARRILRNEADVEELLQETHFNAVRHLDRFEGRCSFLTWLTTIAVHDAVARTRKRARFVDLDAASTPGNWMGVELASADRDPEQQMIDEECRQLLSGAVAALPEEYRSVFQLREIEELSTAEAAALLQISQTCLKTRLYRAKTLLRRKLHHRLKWARYAVIRNFHQAPGVAA